MTIENPGNGKRGAGSNKSRRKKREYKAHVHAMLAGGRVNDDRGVWISTSGIKDDKVRDRAEKLAAKMS